jgi:DNA polymerase III alpha subunit
VDLDNFHLPDYVLTEEQSKNFKDKNELFLSLVEEGFKIRVPKGKEKEYRERLDREIGVISQGYNLEDYFLILWDIIHWCDSNNILVGIGRGSAGGCLISFLLGIVRLDPIKYDLLFERFLNENRIKKSLPDVDCDFEGLRRDDIKAYMENRFGLDNVCSVGTYANMKLKMAISDLAKLNNIDFATSKMITAILDDVENEGTKWDDIFRLCSTSERLRSFVKYNGDIINDIQLILMQPRSASVHACATIVTPSNKTIFEWFPVKKMKNKNDQDVLVSEWEGFYLDKAGFLKEDILGIQQLDKFKFIMNLVKSNRDKTIDIYNLNLEDKKVFKYFSNGWNEDVFQFGTRGLKQYSKEVRPDSVEELTAMNALFRPGAMKSNAHSDYVDIKFGKKEPEYDYMLKSVTSKTYGLYIYQEQTMLAAQKLGGFTLAEADMMRKVMLNSAGKKQERDKFYLYMNAFVDGAVKNGCDKNEATRIWNKLEAFAAYGFNRCFSAQTRLKRLGFNKKGSAVFIPTVEEMFFIKNSKKYAIKNGHLSLHKKYKNEGFGKSYSLKDDRLIKNDIIDIRYAGERENFRMTLESGLTIEITDNHKFPTSNGEKELKDIDINKDLILVNDGYDKTISNRFVFTDKTKYLDEIDNPLMYEYKLNSEKGKIGFQKLENIPSKVLDNYKQNDKKDVCEECGNSHDRLEVHHKNGLHGDSEKGNFITVCPSCHKKIHYRDFNRRKQGDKGLLVRFEKIIKIENVGIRPVYDVEMADPYHTVTIDNGIIASNSHSIAYAVTGYICQYLKVHYPIEFWTCAFTFVPTGKQQEKIPAYISEIHQTGDINMFPPNINKSGDGFTPNFENNSIYWSLNSVKQCGDKAVEQLVEGKQKDGEYFSFDEFLERNVAKGSKVTKQVVEHLILCGAFDDIEKIKQSRDRYELINTYRKRFKIKIDKIKDIFSLNADMLQYNWWWNLQQKRLCGFALFDFTTICENYLDSTSKYMDAISIQDRESDKVSIVTGGYINEITIRTSKKGEYAEITLDNNFEFITLKLWQDSWDAAKDILIGKDKSLLLLSGKISYDKYKKKNVVTLFEDSDILILE